jgi:hypothetical protein
VRKNVVVLLGFGGSRIGDTFHVIPLLKELKRNHIECHWMHGIYEAGVCEFLKKAGYVSKLIPTNFVQGKIGAFDVNPDMSSVTNFIAEMEDNPAVNLDDYGCVITPQLDGYFNYSEDLGIDLSTCQWAGVNVPDVTIPGYVREDNYIGCQPASVSDFKTYRALYAIDFPGDVKCFGFPGEPMIRDSIQIQNNSISDVFEELNTCGMVVSTHSAIGIMAYYLGMPLVFIHFWDGGLANLADRDNIIQLKKPSKFELQEAIDKIYQKYVIGKEVVNA